MPQINAQNRPDLILPDDLVLNCGDFDYDEIIDWMASVEVVNNCPQYTLTNDYDGRLPSLCGDTKVIRWQYRDICGDMLVDSARLSKINSGTELSFVSCPDNIIFRTDTISCPLLPFFTTPTALDCFGPTEVNQIPNSDGLLFPSGAAFPIGTTEVGFEAIDNCGRTATCTFNIIIIPNEVPNVSCPSNDVLVCADENDCGWTSNSVISPTTIFNQCAQHNFSYRITLPDETVVFSDDIMDDDGDPSGMKFPLGKTEICYTVADASGSILSLCCFDVIVNDCQRPVMICPGDAMVECRALQSGNPFNAWLDLSIRSDNCDTSLIFRTELIDTIEACGDIVSANYLLVAIDDAGNNNGCITTFNVIDTVAPVITSVSLPRDTVECDGSMNLPQLEEWLATNGGYTDDDVDETCGSFTWKFDPRSTGFIEQRNCPVIGYYQVNFFVEDGCGNTSNSVRARLYLRDTQVPIIEGPESLVLFSNERNLNDKVNDWISMFTSADSCSTISLAEDFNGLPNNFQEDTTVVNVNFLALDICNNETILRRNITVIKSEESVITSPRNLFLRCGEDFDSLIGDWLTDFELDLKCDSFTVVHTFDADLLNRCGGDVSVNWVLTDTCGTATSASATITVAQDVIPPVFLSCPSNITLSSDPTMEGCGAFFEFVIPEAEDCNGPIAINLENISSLPDGVLNNVFPIGTTTIMFSATDHCGSQAFCNYSVTVVDNECQNNGNVAISGSLRTESGFSVPNVTVNLEADLPEYPLVKISDEAGYAFSNLPREVSYTVRPKKTDDPLNGLSTLDLVLMQRHILGILPLSTAYQVIAADVNGSESVSSADIILATRVLVGLDDNFPNDESWKFVDASQTFSNALLPFPFREAITFTNLQNNINDANFIAIKNGDVSGNADPGFKSEEVLLKKVAKTIKIEDKKVLQGALVELPIDLDSGPIYGLQMSISLDDFEFLNSTSDQLKIGTHIFEESRVLHIVWYDSEGASLKPFSINLRSRVTADLSKTLSFSDQLIPEFYTGEQLVSKRIGFEFINEKPKTILHQNYPNPFADATTIAFSLSQSEEVSLRILDFNGKLLYNEKCLGQKGLNSIVIEKSTLLTSGIYYYVLQTGEGEFSKRMVFLK